MTDDLGRAVWSVSARDGVARDQAFDAGVRPLTTIVRSPTGIRVTGLPDAAPEPLAPTA